MCFSHATRGLLHAGEVGITCLYCGSGLEVIEIADDDEEDQDASIGTVAETAGIVDLTLSPHLETVDLSRDSPSPPVPHPQQRQSETEPVLRVASAPSRAHTPSQRKRSSPAPLEVLEQSSECTSSLRADPEVKLNMSPEEVQVGSDARRTKTTSLPIPEADSEIAKDLSAMAIEEPPVLSHPIADSNPPVSLPTEPATKPVKGGTLGPEWIRERLESSEHMQLWKRVSAARPLSQTRQPTKTRTPAQAEPGLIFLVSPCAGELTGSMLFESTPRRTCKFFE
ncbi:unnamed protein product [Mycena citricolor]|uniref:Uncharacterized protein n=1 Tax=Mycena citricolor TaxID=2018698 RepID=A0AAD2Q563_9AGAR|nr:unnamed protein product [Mycena citricolor]